MIKNYWTYNKAFLLIVIVFAFGCIDETKEKTKLAGATSVEKNQMQLNIIWFGLLQNDYTQNNYDFLIYNTKKSNNIIFCQYRKVSPKAKFFMLL